MRIGQNALILLAAVWILTGCTKQETVPADLPEGYPAQTMYLGAAEGSGTIHTAGRVVATVLNNTVPGTHTAIKYSKGSPINAVNVAEGNLDMAIIYGDVAYDAFYGQGDFEDKKQDKLCALAACYPVVSGWMAKKDSGLSYVHELNGNIAVGTLASDTQQISALVCSILELDEGETEIKWKGLSEGAQAVKEGSVTAAHGFTAVPLEAHTSAAAESEMVFLSYTDEELENILASDARLFGTEILAGTYPGQEDDVQTFGMKVLLCASTDMDEDLAYQIAMAMDVNGPVYTAEYPFLSRVQDKEFLSNDLPIPLHDGAARYYREMGYIQ